MSATFLVRQISIETRTRGFLQEVSITKILLSCDTNNEIKTQTRVTQNVSRFLAASSLETLVERHYQHLTLPCVSTSVTCRELLYSWVDRGNLNT